MFGMEIVLCVLDNKHIYLENFYVCLVNDMFSCICSLLHGQRSTPYLNLSVIGSSFFVLKIPTFSLKSIYLYRIFSDFSLANEA